MTRTAAALLAVVLVIGSVSAFPMAAAAQSTSSSIASAIGDTTYAQVDGNASDTAGNVTAGERLSAVVGIVQAEFEGEVERRAYGIEFARAASDDAKAGVVADRFENIRDRLAELEQQQQALQEARENGRMSEGRFQARMAELSARVESVEQLADASEARAGSLPEDVLTANGVNVTAIQTLRTQAEALSGGEVARIAQAIAGPNVGQSISQGPPSQVGTPTQSGDGDAGDADAQAAIDRAESQLDAAETRLAQAEERFGANASENATEALEQARAELERARTALEDARAAMDGGDAAEASELAEDALSHAEQAEARAQDALDEAQRSGADSGSTSGSDEGTPSETGEDAGDGGDY